MEHIADSALRSDLAENAPRIDRQVGRHPDALPPRVRLRIRRPLHNARIPTQDRGNSATAEPLGDADPGREREVAPGANRQMCTVDRRWLGFRQPVLKHGAARRSRLIEHTDCRRSIGEPAAGV